MTLSTHVPIAPREGTPQLGCERGGGAMRQLDVCYTSEMWADVLSKPARMTADIPPTDILIVGDHAPLWSKFGRQLFTPGKGNLDSIDAARHFSRQCVALNAHGGPARRHANDRPLRDRRG
jgi:hypothetical protein